jgi:hypothetical protein
LRALVRSRDDLVAERVALGNRLRSLLDGFWPSATAIFAHVDSPIALAFLQRYPGVTGAGDPSSLATPDHSVIAWRPSPRSRNWSRSPRCRRDRRDRGYRR